MSFSKGSHFSHFKFLKAVPLFSTHFFFFYLVPFNQSGDNLWFYAPLGSNIIFPEHLYYRAGGKKSQTEQISLVVDSCKKCVE